MPMFRISKNMLLPVGQTNFQGQNGEKQLQGLVERSLLPVFSCRFVATEFGTGPRHSGRIDTLALSEENNPVIIEYKVVQSPEIVNQGLYYLQWIQDHKGDFEKAAHKALGRNIKIDWSDVRVICIAPSYSKFSLPVQVRKASIELWKYRLFSNDGLYLERIMHDSTAATSDTSQSRKNPVMVEAGRKAAQVRATAVYTFNEHIEGKPKPIQELVLAIQELVTGLDSAIDEVPKKYYIAYKATQNILCVSVKTENIRLFLKLNPTEVVDPPDFFRDVTDIGHVGTGDVEFTLSTQEELEEVKKYIVAAYNKVGG